MDIRNVLVPVDFSVASNREVDLAVEICRPFGARLILHHNQDAAPLGMSRAWDWEEHHPGSQGHGPAIERLLCELIARVPDDVAVEAVISRGLILPSILALAGRVPADLVVVATHGGDRADHSSVAQRLIERAPCPVLALHDGAVDPRPLRLLGTDGSGPQVLVPTDLEDGSLALLSYAFALARRLPLRLCLSHVTLGRAEAAHAKLASLVPEDLVERVVCEVQLGVAAGRIVASCERLHADFVVMGEHAHGLRGLLTHDTARDVLRHAPCPVWFVPQQMAA